IAQVLEDQHRFDEALGHAEQALQLADDRAGQADALNQVGWYHAQLGHYHQALDYSQQSLDLHQELGSDPHGQAAAWAPRRFAYPHLDDHPAATSSYGQAVALFETAGDRYKQAETLIRLGRTHQAAGDTEMARDTLEEAEMILNELDHPDTRIVR